MVFETILQIYSPSIGIGCIEVQSVRFWDIVERNQCRAVSSTTVMFLGNCDHLKNLYRTMFRLIRSSISNIGPSHIRHAFTICSFETQH